MAQDPRGAALLLIDIDNVKNINDLRGHAAGDRVIRRIARTVAARVPPGALVGRLGGDEFAVVVPSAGAGEAVGLAERLCDAVAETTIVDEAGSTRVPRRARYRVTAAVAWPPPVSSNSLPRSAMPGANCPRTVVKKVPLLTTLTE